MNRMPESLPRTQQGMSMFALAMLLLLITGVFTIGLKLAPLYIDHNLIVGICEELIENGEAANMTVADVRERLANSLRINNVTGFDVNDVRLRQTPNGPLITISYERRVELFANLDAIATFDTVLP